MVLLQQPRKRKGPRASLVEYHKERSSDPGIGKRRVGVLRIVFVTAVLLAVLVRTRISPRWPLEWKHLPETVVSDDVRAGYRGKNTARSYSERLLHPRVVRLRNCSVAFTAPQNMSFNPLWLPSYPASGAASASRKGDLLKPIVNSLTGWTSGLKNYHMSIRNKLRRCHATNTATAVCSNSHPLVNVGPRNQHSNFDKKVIMVIRNFYTVHPAMLQDKAFAYHGATEQMPKDEWRKLRDAWTRKSFESWRSFFVEWKNMSDLYDTSYVLYEQLMEPETGVEVVQGIARTLEMAGLDIAPFDEIECAWFRAIQPEYLRLERLIEYEPAYTRELYAFLVTEMERLIHDIDKTKDDALVTILRNYLAEMQRSIKMENE